MADPILGPRIAATLGFLSHALIEARLNGVNAVLRRPEVDRKRHLLDDAQRVLQILHAFDTGWIGRKAHSKGFDLPPQRKLQSRSVENDVVCLSLR